VDGCVEVVKLLSVGAAARDIRCGSCVRRDDSRNADGAEGERSRVWEQGVILLQTTGCRGSFKCIARARGHDAASHACTRTRR
jgi:hypothetical protein